MTQGELDREISVELAPEVAFEVELLSPDMLD